MGERIVNGREFVVRNLDEWKLTAREAAQQNAVERRRQQDDAWVERQLAGAAMGEAWEPVDDSPTFGAALDARGNVVVEEAYPGDEP